MRVEFVRRTSAAIPVARLRRALEACARHFKLPPNSEVSVCSVDAKMIRKLNERHRGKSYVADVLSFPQCEGKNIAKAVARAARKEPIVPIGDIVLNRAKLAEEAVLFDRRVNEHIEAMVVHSFLHLLGFDHEDSRDRRRMERAEHAILRSL